jgi:hypothetical protein
VLLKDEISWSSHSPGGYQKLLTTEVQVQTQSSLCGPCGQRSSGAGLPQGASVPPPPNGHRSTNIRFCYQKGKLRLCRTRTHTHTRDTDAFRLFQQACVSVTLLLVYRRGTLRFLQGLLTFHYSPSANTHNQLFVTQ